MKKHYYKFGNQKCYAYSKTVGHGFEVGFYFGKNALFVGNFIHQKEATKWWVKMNKEMKTFTRRYRVAAEGYGTWYTKMFSRHLYNTYYTFLDHEFGKYQKNFSRACKQDAKKYQSIKKRWNKHETFYNFRKAA